MGSPTHPAQNGFHKPPFYLVKSFFSIYKIEYGGFLSINKKVYDVIYLPKIVHQESILNKARLINMNRIPIIKISLAAQILKIL